MAALRDYGFELVDYPSYSPDLSSSGYRLFFNRKKPIQLRISMAVMMTSILLLIDFYQHDNGFFINGIQELQHRWKNCVDGKGYYVEE